ncbi:hypothetical protein LX36DRAFT_316050 [Colletotrichum falcatum]|nr:hypothetical protein LX36DRAFT_316050 [Colletotrichum falcatum]
MAHEHEVVLYFFLFFLFFFLSFFSFSCALVSLSDGYFPATWEQSRSYHVRHVHPGGGPLAAQAGWFVSHPTFARHRLLKGGGGKISEVEVAVLRVRVERNPAGRGARQRRRGRSGWPNYGVERGGKTAYTTAQVPRRYLVTIPRRCFLNR